MAFDDILGNERTKNILKKALLRKRLPNSLLLQGAEGVGKNEAALVVAKALNCLNKRDDACETCANCKAIGKGNFPDVMILEADKDVIKIEQIRILKNTAYLKPMGRGKRVFIIQHAEKMTEEASNSLLKVLEEPPLSSHIILTTHKDHLLLSTIRSRCQSLVFSSISREDITRRLLEKGYAAEQANIIAMVVGGNIRLALEMNWESVQSIRKLAWDLLWAGLNMKGAASLLYEMTAPGAGIRQEFEQILEILASYMRDLLLLLEGGSQSLLINPDFGENLHELSARLSHERCVSLLNTIEYAIYAQQRKLNYSLLVNLLFSRFMGKNHV